MLVFFFQSAIFECNNFAQNYHPTFEVFLDVNIKEVKLGVLDKNVDEEEVWNRRRIPLTGTHDSDKTFKKNKLLTKNSQLYFKEAIQCLNK